MTEQISSADFQEKVIDASANGPVLVDFFATWCGPCKMMSPVIEEIAAEKAGEASVYKLDIDESMDIAQRIGISSVPTFIVFRDGKPAKHTLGAQPKENILALFD